MNPISRKVVIVGAGIAGLCGAVHARKCGYAATVLEQHERAGGLGMRYAMSHCPLPSLSL